jgi:hypothetical protein
VIEGDAIRVHNIPNFGFIEFCHLRNKKFLEVRRKYGNCRGIGDQ